MCNNNCCMCCKCNNTNDEETPQEIIYTSVCNSASCLQLDQCNCCCCKCSEKGRCEDDPNIRLDGIEERMLECCEKVMEDITKLGCDLEEEIDRSKGKDKEHDDKINDLYNKESIDYNNVDYTLDNHNLVINFYHDDVFQDKITIPVEDFIKDWFVDDVDLINGHILEITFNIDPTTETHHEPKVIRIDLNDFINPSNYYNKTQIDTKVEEINQRITNDVNDLSTFKTYVSNTYETKEAAGNHIKNVEYGPDHHTLIFETENGTRIERTIPDNNDDKYVTGGSVSNGKLTLTRNDGTPIDITIPPTNHIVGGSIDGRVITLVRENGGTPVTLQIPADANTYPTSGSVSDGVLTLNMNEGAAIKIQLPADSDHYVTSGTLSGNTLKLTRQGVSGTVDVDLSGLVITDNDHYVDSASLSGNTLHLGRTGGMSDVTVDLSGISGTTTVNYEGDNVSIQDAIDAIVNRIKLLEGLWKKNSDGLIPVDESRKVYGAGFYDTTVS